MIKPLDFVARNRRRLVQPAVKCRGREYLRIIYGLEYDSGINLSRLRNRRVGVKRSLARREFALGIEARDSFAMNRSAAYTNAPLECLPGKASQ